MGPFQGPNLPSKKQEVTHSLTNIYNFSTGIYRLFKLIIVYYQYVICINIFKELPESHDSLRLANVRISRVSDDFRKFSIK